MFVKVSIFQFGGTQSRVIMQGYTFTYLLCCNVEVWLIGNSCLEVLAIFLNEIKVNRTNKTLVFIKNVCL